MVQQTSAQPVLVMATGINGTAHCITACRAIPSSTRQVTQLPRNRATTYRAPAPSRSNRPWRARRQTAVTASQSPIETLQQTAEIPAFAPWDRVRECFQLCTPCRTQTPHSRSRHVKVVLECYGSRLQRFQNNEWFHFHLIRLLSSARNRALRPASEQQRHIRPSSVHTCCSA